MNNEEIKIENMMSGESKGVTRLIFLRHDMLRLDLEMKDETKWKWKMNPRENEREKESEDEKR